MKRFPILMYCVDIVRVVLFGQTLQHRKMAISNCFCVSEMIVSKINPVFRLLLHGSGKRGNVLFLSLGAFNFYVNQNSSSCSAPSRFNTAGDVRARSLVRFPRLSLSGKRDCS